MRTALIALCALVLVIVIAVGARQALDSSHASKSAGLTRAEVAKPIPGAPPQLAALHRRINDLRDGGATAFDAQLRALRGHPVVVNLWASWCEPCRRELPLFQREAVKRGAQIAFLGLNVQDTRASALGLAGQFPMPYPSFADPHGAIAAAHFHASRLPTTAFFDARGKLQIVQQGEFANEARLATAITRYALAPATASG
jgi:cytochrome c biogenesis protein CcmG/thiol:disulfide interchange protein DsbE